MEFENKVMTVKGPVRPDELGSTLTHEHVLVDFIGAEHISPDRYDADDVVRLVVPRLEAAQRLGMKTLVECTPSYIGKDPLLLKRLSEETGIIFLTNTGYYGARNGHFLPSHAYTDTADQLADRWVKEWEEGIDDTGIRPGFIKTAVNLETPLSAVDRKLIQAAGRTHLRTGLTIVSHTKHGPVLEEVEVLRSEGVDPGAFIWAHADLEPDPRRHVAVAELGAWVDFDGVTLPIDNDVKRLVHMKAAGVLDRVLISHDGGWFDPGKPQGGPADYKPYTVIYEHLFPALRSQGFTDAEITRLMVENPARAFAVKVKEYSAQG